MNILFVNAAVRENSRTKILADYLLNKLSGQVTTIDLNADKPLPLNRESLEKRNHLIAQKKFDDDMFFYARAFQKAEIVVICAPYWDFSFPALIKTFIEHINVGGLVFKYADDGSIVSLCNAKKLYYVTTMGGHNPTDFGFGYIKALCDTLYGIQDAKLIKAEGLDIIGNDVSLILENAKKQIDAMFENE